MTQGVLRAHRRRRCRPRPVRRRSPPPGHSPRGAESPRRPATALDAADALTDARRVPLEELVNPVDARVAEEMGEAGTVMRAEDLPELTRCADTAEQLGALRETLRVDAPGATTSGATSFGTSRGGGRLEGFGVRQAPSRCIPQAAGAGRSKSTRPQPSTARTRASFVPTPTSRGARDRRCSPGSPGAPTVRLRRRRRSPTSTRPIADCANLQSLLPHLQNGHPQRLSSGC